MTPPDPLKEKIARWLVGRGWRFEERSTANLSWVLCFLGEGFSPKISIYRPPIPGDVVLATIKSQLSDSQKAKFWALAHEERVSLLWDLRMTVASMDMEGQIGEDLTVEANVRYYLDALTQDLFWRRMLTLQNTFLLLSLKICKSLGDTFDATGPVAN